MDKGSSRLGSAWRRFVASESLGGACLIGGAIVALILANSPWASEWRGVLHRPVLGVTLEAWVNDGLMSAFFLLVGLEIKSELVQGQLNSWKRRALPAIAALGGMVVPAVLYLLVNLTSPASRSGWAIPAATDIAFALAVLAALGPRVPVSLKVFLTALAILDDLGAIVIIGGFYSHDLVWMALAGAGLMAVILLVLNRLHVMAIWAYALPGAALWWFLHHSGVHPTLAGVVVAFAIPARRWPARPEQPASPLHLLENALDPWVAFGVLPIFALVNAGIGFRSLEPGVLATPAALGVLAGLVVGKPVGVFGAAWTAVRLGWAEPPARASWAQLFGVAVLCGIGFTMSLLIGVLAFRDPALAAAAKTATLLGSVLSALAGAAILVLARPKDADAG